VNNKVSKMLNDNEILLLFIGFEIGKKG